MNHTVYALYSMCCRAQKSHVSQLAKDQNDSWESWNGSLGHRHRVSYIGRSDCITGQSSRPADEPSFGVVTVIFSVEKHREWTSHSLPPPCIRALEVSIGAYSDSLCCTGLVTNSASARLKLYSNYQWNARNWTDTWHHTHAHRFIGSCCWYCRLYGSSLAYITVHRSRAYSYSAV